VVQEDPGAGGAIKIIDGYFKMPPSIPGRLLCRGDAAIHRGGQRVGSIVQNAQVQAPWLACVLQDRGGEHPVPALPSCGLYDALVLVVLEALQNLDSALCKNRGVAFFAWLYNLLGGAAEKLVSPPRFGNTARKSLLKAATTECNRFCKLTISQQRAEVNRATSPAARERTTAALNGLLDLARHTLQWRNKKYGGGLGNVWVMVKYSDGSTTPGYVSSEFLGDTKEGLDVLRAYTKETGAQNALSTCRG